MVISDLLIENMRLTLRPVDVGDEQFVYRVYASTRADEMALVNWTPEQQEAFLRMQVNAQTDHYKIHFPTAEQYIIQREDLPVGRLILNRLEDMIHIIDIALLPEARNAGIGTAIMNEVMEEAAQDNRQVMLRVEFFNPARRLYARLGFEQTREMSIYHEMIWKKAESSE